MALRKWWLVGAVILLAAIIGGAVNGKEKALLGQRLPPQTASSTAQGSGTTIQTEGRATYAERLFVQRISGSLPGSGPGYLETESRAIQRSFGSGKGRKQSEPRRLVYSAGTTGGSQDGQNGDILSRDTGGLNSRADYRGTFTVTAYTAGPESTGKRPGDPAYGITASGAEVEEGRTIAADWKVLPPGTRVYIEDVGERVVEDKGGAIKGQKIDLYIADLDEALEWGRQEKALYVIEWGKEE